ncbi:molybdopterin-synthase adenylyltransferase MoeB [Tatumella saanichensis]|uniref:molybdopterin-synthase adenylyltransferase MoeB n=1 Tax=Tatumella saanichensis TaxID=480813 RepID=UPI0004A24E6D|nr:molybdopterin-synthase adenylyltransferase MoeB [Tatumella saanichensis]
MTVALTDEEILRYNRQIVLHGFDFDKQEKLKASRVLLVGLGGLGCAAAPYLVTAGIGELTLLDFDKVSLSNLQRQILHTSESVGSAKTTSALQRLTPLNPHTRLIPLARPLSEENAETLIMHQHAVVDCSDNLATRELLNRVCHRHRVPLISGAAIRMEGQLAVFRWQQNEPCYRCISRLFGEQDLSCVEAGVMSPLVGVIGSLQAMETLKVVAEYGQSPAGKLIFYEAMTCQFRELRIPRDPQCEVCGH